jgi:hypothetical protein
LLKTSLEAIYSTDVLRGELKLLILRLYKVKKRTLGTKLELKDLILMRKSFNSLCMDDYLLSIDLLILLFIFLITLLSSPEETPPPPPSLLHAKVIFRQIHFVPKL